MKRIAAALLALSCAKYKAPPSVPTIAMPSGDALKPFDPGKPSLARPGGIDIFNGKAYVALGNYDADYAVRGPGLLAVLTPTTGATSIIDLGGPTERGCLEPYWVRDSGGRLYVTCTGDAFNTGDGEAITEVDPATGTVTRTVKTPTVVEPGATTATGVSPQGLAITPSKIWFGDARSGNVYAVDRTSFTVVAGPLPIPCPTTGTYTTTNDVILVQGDLYAACSNSTGGILSRLDANTGAVKMQTDSGPTAVEFTETGDGRIAIVSGADNNLRLVTIGQGALTTAVAYTYSGDTSLLQDIHARDNFLFTAASGSNTVQKLDLTRSGAKMLVGEANVGLSAFPFNVVPLDDDQVLVANQTGNTVVSVSSDCSGGKVCWAVPK
jgi:WD40 repeat protein